MAMTFCVQPVDTYRYFHMHGHLSGSWMDGWMDGGMEGGRDVFGLVLISLCGSVVLSALPYLLACCSGYPLLCTVFGHAALHVLLIYSFVLILLRHGLID